MCDQQAQTKSPSGDTFSHFENVNFRDVFIITRRSFQNLGIVVGYKKYNWELYTMQFLSNLVITQLENNC